MSEFQLAMTVTAQVTVKRFRVWAKGLVCIFSCLCLLIACPAFAQKPLVWGYVHFPPFTSQGKDGQVEGFLADITLQVLKEENIPFSAVELPNRRALTLINSGDIHFGVFSKSFMDNTDDFVLSKFPVSQVELRAYWTGKKPEIIHPSDLNGKKLILLTAYTYGGLRDYFQDPLNGISVVANIEQHHRAFQALKIGRGEYLLNYRGPATRSLQQIDVPDLKFSPLKTIDIYFMINKGYQNAAAVMARMEEQFVKINGAGMVKMSVPKQ